MVCALVELFRLTCIHKTGILKPLNVTCNPVTNIIINYSFRKILYITLYIHTYRWSKSFVKAWKTMLHDFSISKSQYETSFKSAIMNSATFNFFYFNCVENFNNWSHTYIHRRTLKDWKSINNRFCQICDLQRAL